jgi:RNA polymerase sigma factor (sigma-70 family)
VALEDLAADDDAAAASAASAALQRALDAYLSCLDEDVRATIVLRHGLGHTVPEIAALMATSPNTVKKRLQRGRLALRKMIRREQLTGAPRARGGLSP